jgi:hypothetical protein
MITGLRKFLICLGLIVGTLGFAGGYACAEGDDLVAKVKDAMKEIQAKSTAVGAPSISGTEALGDVTVPVLMFGSTKINGNYDLVDALKTDKGCAATIFVKNDPNFVRVSTNVLKDNKRALGTILSPNGNAYSAISMGKAYYGRADILGQMYETGYEPIKNAQGEVLGLFFVGFPVEPK